VLGAGKRQDLIGLLGGETDKERAFRDQRWVDLGQAALPKLRPADRPMIGQNRGRFYYALAEPSKPNIVWNPLY
jgi:hypothetical protein